jgi:hypothetical protein
MRACRYNLIKTPNKRKLGFGQTERLNPTYFVRVVSNKCKIVMKSTTGAARMLAADLRFQARNTARWGSSSHPPDKPTDGNTSTTTTTN